MPLSYEEVVAITYNSSDMAIILTPEQQSLVVQALSVFTDAINWTDYDTYQDEIQAYVADTLDQLLETEIPPPVTILPTIALFAVNGIVSGGTLTFTQAAFMPFGYSMDTDTVQNRYIRNPVWLPEGTFEIIWHYAKTTASGNVDLLLTDTIGNIITTIASIDQYGLFNARFTNGQQFDVPSDGFYELRPKNDGTKNAASTGYRVSSTAYFLRQIS